MLAKIQGVTLSPVWETEKRAPVLGIIGGGQLAQMLFQSAISIGVEVHILRSEGDQSLNSYAKELTVASSFDATTLYHFARRCDVVTFDHELIPAQIVSELSSRNCTMLPTATTLALAADKARQRRTLAEAGIPTPRFAVVESAAEVEAISAAFKFPLMLKAARGGYDGRGVVEVSSMDEVISIFGTSKMPVPYVVEERLDLDAELSVLVVRSSNRKEVSVYQPIRTRQHEGICVEASWPSHLPRSIDARAVEIALSIAELVDSVGVLAVEFFVVGGEVLVNELAPRVHNSGHLTIEAAKTSQFENHIRAVLGFALGSTDFISPASMVNLIAGPDAKEHRPLQLAAALSVAGASLHDYHKSPKPKRKVGHVTVLADSTTSASADAWESARRAMMAPLLGDPMAALGTHQN